MQEDWQEAYLSVSAAVPLPWGHCAAHWVVALAWAWLGQGTLTQAAWQQISVRAPIWFCQYVSLSNHFGNIQSARQVCSGDSDCVDVEVEWVVVETVELSVARLVLTCAVATAARPRLTRAKNFIVAVLRTSLVSTRVDM